jgi:hypothetical protein
MIAKGVGEVRGIHSLNTRPGPLTESKAFLRLYQLAAEKDNLMKKIEWVRRQKNQTEKRLSEIIHMIRAVEVRVEKLGLKP